MRRGQLAGIARTFGPLAELGRGLLDAALPQTCVACGEWIPGSAGLACEGCHATIAAAISSAYCPRCGRTLPRTAIHEDGCARCKSEPFWNVAGVARIGRYGPQLRAVLLGLKYAGRERNADYLAELMGGELRRLGWLEQLDALVPVPMHWLRRLQRPCDHARVLATALARVVDVPVVRLVRRARHGPSQTQIPIRTRRFENVCGCFALARWRSRWAAGKTVCIIDNLLVTGATVYEVSKVLRKAGAKRIYAAVISRPAAPGDPRAAVVAQEVGQGADPVAQGHWQ